MVFEFVSVRFGSVQIKWVAFVGLGIMFFAVIVNGFVASFFRILQASNLL